MKRFANYYLEQLLYQGRKTEIWRGHQAEQESTVIIKLPVDEYPSQTDFSRLKHEYDLLQRLERTGAVHPVEFLTYAHSCAIVMQDHGERILSELLQDRPLPIAQCLHIAIGLTSLLGVIHSREIIHKD